MQMKKEIVHYAKMMDKHGLVVGTAGNISVKVGNNNGVLLANHGVIAVGTTLKDAFRRAEAIEEVAFLAFGCHTLNSVKPLSEKELADAAEGFKTYVSS